MGGLGEEEGKGGGKRGRRRARDNLEGKGGEGEVEG